MNYSSKVNRLSRESRLSRAEFLLLLLIPSSTLHAFYYYINTACQRIQAWHRSRITISMKTRLVRSVMNWIWIEQRANLQDKCLPWGIEFRTLGERAPYFSRRKFSHPLSSPCPKIIGLESKITGKGSISIRRRISSQVNLAKLRYEFSMKFLQTFLFRSLNVEGYRAFLSRNFSCGTCISPRSCAFFFLGRNWIVVTDSDQKSKNFISDTHTFRHLSRTIIEKSCLATDERERTKISIEEDFYARNLDKGRFDREWEIKCWNGNYGGEIARWTRFFLVLSSKIPLNAIRWKVFGPRFEWSRFLKCKCGDV